MVVEADVFADGHDSVRAHLLWKREGAEAWQRVTMEPLGNDRWRAEFPVDQVGRYLYTVSGAIDHFASWRNDLKKRIAAGQEVSLDLQAGALLLEGAASSASGPDAAKLKNWATALRNAPAAGANGALTLAFQQEIE